MVGLSVAYHFCPLLYPKFSVLGFGPSRNGREGAIAEHSTGRNITLCSSNIAPSKQDACDDTLPAFAAYPLASVAMRFAPIYLLALRCAAPGSTSRRSQICRTTASHASSPPRCSPFHSSKSKPQPFMDLPAFVYRLLLGSSVDSASPLVNKRKELPHEQSSCVSLFQQERPQHVN